MKKLLINIVAMLSFTACLTEHDVDFTLPAEAPQTLLYHQNDVVKPFTLSFEGVAPETMADGALNYDISKVAWIQASDTTVVEDSINPFSINQETGVIQYTPHDSTKLGAYLIDVMLNNEVGTTAFTNAYRAVLEDWRPIVSIEAEDENIELLIDNTGQPLSSIVTDAKVNVVRCETSDVKIDITPALPEGTQLLLHSTGYLYFTGAVEQNTYTVVLSAENEYGEAQEQPMLYFHTKVASTVERPLFEMEITSNYKPDGLTEFEFEGMFFKQISGPEITSATTWWNINREKKNHPDQSRNGNYITRCYARTLEENSQAEHMMVPLGSFDTENLQTIMTETGVLFNAGVDITGDQRIEIRAVGETAYNEAIANNDVASKIDDWPLVYTTAEHERTEKGWFFIHHNAEAGVKINDAKMKIVVLYRHMGATNSGYMGLDQLKVTGKYLLFD
ncbi:hypothetical protein [Flammeovirga sp. EKP202]|uniref:hypothetical protein n=1 Tax=Flammeovirga sp. EKP202 TaxID=2770592 RepID=UPI00165FC4A8|nr:hypothetical protein [Flammeovirga sp. EKP202]MBD0400580.1 hypothetical protein [Flammeovirga sp. EKP202]